MVILCGSSSQLVVLALRHSNIKMAQELLASYPGYDSLNNQKFTPTTLNALQWSDMESVSEVL